MLHDKNSAMAAPIQDVNNGLAMLPKHKPATPIPKEKQVIPTRKECDIMSFAWFHGKITRAEAEKLLKDGRNGEFLVRESRNYAGDFTLSVHYESRVEHYRVIHGKQSFLTIDGEIYFENMAKLVEHYEQGAFGLCIRLKYPVKVNKGDVESHDVESHALISSDLLVKYRDISKKQGVAEMWQGEYLGMQVAIKVFRCSSEVIAKTSQKLAELSSLLSSIQHDNLATFIGISVDEPQICFVTKHVVKGSLVSFLRSRGRKYFSKEKLLHLAAQVCSGMCHLESLSVIHGNLAVHNVLLEDDDTAKVTDFGVAQIAGDVLMLKSSNSSVRWSAPEVVKSKTFSTKADVWSFGVLLWELFSYGRVPYPGKTVDEIIQLIDEDHMMDSPDDCPEGVNVVMQKAWYKVPTHRPSFTELKQQLQSIKLT